MANGARRRTRQRGLAAAAAVAVVLAVAAFLFAYTQATHQATSARHLAAADERAAQGLAAEVRSHCLEDVWQANRRRHLDLALLAADNRFRVALAGLLPHADPTERGMITAHIRFLGAVIDARHDDLPRYENAARCATVVAHRHRR